jgi:uncharacterized membrane protein
VRRTEEVEVGEVVEQEAAIVEALPDIMRTMEEALRVFDEERAKWLAGEPSSYTPPPAPVWRGR